MQSLLTKSVFARSLILVLSKVRKKKPVNSMKPEIIMSPDIINYIENEFLLLDRLINMHRPLIEIAKREVPED
jgi:hypothetical protein